MIKIIHTITYNRLIKIELNLEIIDLLSYLKANKLCLHFSLLECKVNNLLDQLELTIRI